MISVVIPAYNEELVIGKCLEAFLSQESKTPFEIIVVDNASEDKTDRIVKSFENRLPVHLIKEDKKGRSPARRAGFAAAKGDIILSTDADTIVPINWIEDLYSNFTDLSIVGVTGSCRIVDCSKRVNTIFNYFQPLSMKLYRLVFGHYWFSGFNFAVRKDAYMKVGGFNPRLNVQEDTDLAFRISKIGKIKYVNKPVVIFSGRRFRKGILRGLYPYIISFINYFIRKDEKSAYLNDVR